MVHRSRGFPSVLVTQIVPPSLLDPQQADQLCLVPDCSKRHVEQLLEQFLDGEGAPPISTHKY